MNKTFDKIENWANSLTTRLTDMRFWDVEEIKTSLKVHLAIAMKDCLSIQISETKRKINQTKILINNCGGKNQQKYIAELIKLKQQHEEERNTLTQTEAIVRKDEKFKILSRLVAERFGDDIFQELKSATKKELNIISETGNEVTENAYQRGVRETKENLELDFEECAVNFLEWTLINGWRKLDGIWEYSNGEQHKTSRELYELFKSA